MKMNPEQQTAANHVDGPLLVLAGAGSGKTRVVTCRIIHLLQLGIHPSSVLAVTFTNKAASEMRHRIQNQTHANVLICTFHHLGVLILRESIAALGYSSGFTIYDEDDSNRLLRDCLDQLSIKDKDLSVKVFKNLISNAKNQLIVPDTKQSDEHASPVEFLFPEVYALYQSKLQEYNAVDFDDLLFLTVKLLQTHAEILEKYQERWKYLLIDEYQDTNHAQYTLVRLLVEKTQNLFVVGDPDQSIYSWRGANLRNILNFQEDFPGAKIIRLEQNYRSRANILNAANQVILHNLNRFEKKLWSDLGEGEKIFKYTAEDERAEADFVTRQIQLLHAERSIPLSDMVVFYRTNFQSRVFEDSLLKKRIPYVIVGGISFYQRKEIKDILSFMRLLHSPADFVSFSRMINIPKRGFGDTSLEKLRLGSEQTKMPILIFCQALLTGMIHDIECKLSAKQKTGLKEFIDVMNELKTIALEGSLKKLVAETIRQTKYLEYLKAEDKETFDDRLANLQELVSKAAEWEQSTETPTLSLFLEELSLKSTLDEVSDSHERVNLMTLHNGKGLEFLAVFLVGLEEDLFPHANSRGSHESLEEERRLCYVGMTRAREYLYLSSAQSRFLWGTSRYMRPSRFLSEIPKDFLHNVRTSYYLPFDE